ETRLRSLGSLIRRHFPLAALFSAALEVKRPQKIDCGFPQSITAWACYLVFKDRAACCDFVACRLVSPGGVAASISVRSQRQLRFCVLRASSKFVGAVQ
ncbi:hypothetical protein, partial [Corallococcus sp. AB038B]|uniref:hypothetical protein n=2 Tax=Corallococcus TaxID=83461 RepID=UPI001F3661D5